MTGGDMLVGLTLLNEHVNTIKLVLLDAYLVSALEAVGAIQEDNHLDLPTLLRDQQKVAGALLSVLSSEVETPA